MLGPGGDPGQSPGPRDQVPSGLSAGGNQCRFVAALDERTLAIRTYERGVEDETLACGTGTVAAALVAATLGIVSSPVDVRVRSGETLTVSFTGNGTEFHEVFFEGDVRLIYQGELMAEALKE